MLFLRTTIIARIIESKIDSYCLELFLNKVKKFIIFKHLRFIVEILKFKLLASKHILYPFFKLWVLITYFYEYQNRFTDLIYKLNGSIRLEGPQCLGCNITLEEDPIYELRRTFELLMNLTLKALESQNYLGWLPRLSSKWKCCWMKI